MEILENGERKTEKRLAVCGSPAVASRHDPQLLLSQQKSK